MSTLFIDNLPQHFSSQELRKIFSNQGHVIDAYVPPNSTEKGAR